MYTPYYSRIENLVRKILLAHGIRVPEQLTIDNVANKLGLAIRRDPDASARLGRLIIIKKGTPQEEWIRFAHEVCHYYEHCGNQLEMADLFRELQEYQAKLFAYHFCIPTFMLDRIRLPPDQVSAVRLLCTTFNIDPDFAEKRLELYKNRLWQRAELSSV